MKYVFQRWSSGLFGGAASLFAAASAHAQGRLTEPASRVVLCAEHRNMDCPIDLWRANAMEGGKFFPATKGGLLDPIAPTDVQNAAPPADGHIAGSGVRGDVPLLDEQTPTRWEKIRLHSGAKQKFKWEYDAPHLTRRWNYFITRADWNPSSPLTRAQFEVKPFCTIQNGGQPFWDPNANLMPTAPTVHMCELPRRTGYQVILAVWELANSPMAFYQIVDATFEERRSSSTSGSD
ncbi:lytic polysaccharide monooxygenase [Bradyrhizobium sp. CCGUVB1N3]|uniref:lytic polysaccharide monooxygenase n=1 Tax=Bradyrhizobium sp. CCGUVB1N3 TaxID=2949629 RepID=UPI0020B1F0EE|nr:lytic polysaccharide monooxygenase [Bradyrhizobium sp. CCGUVB1N3]MCP3475851.1 lytic polysaccharide monooxygenase [Bradyrhizobium sp. CCGUVB1N3]